MNIIGYKKVWLLVPVEVFVDTNTGHIGRIVQPSMEDCQKCLQGPSNRFDSRQVAWDQVLEPVTKRYR